MFVGFVPVLIAFLAALLSLRAERSARAVWAVSALFVAIWATFHGSNHLPSLLTYGAW
jgi:Na+/proline symporter